MSLIEKPVVKFGHIEHRVSWEDLNVEKLNVFSYDDGSVVVVLRDVRKRAFTFHLTILEADRFISKLSGAVVEATIGYSPPDDDDDTAPPAAA